MSEAQDKVTMPLVSVIIPCFNQGCYLWKSIESVLKQTYLNTEIIVVDDGSTDDTPEVAARYPTVKYIYQPNKGLSGARNTGIKQSTGEFLSFLDADDWLYPLALEHQVIFLLQHKEHSFVSGAFDEIFVDENRIHENVRNVQDKHYHRLLEGNYIGMIATVLFRRYAFQYVRFDESLRNCEDYDVYLKIARNHPVGHQQFKIAAYRYHTANMSGNIPSMLQGVLNVLERHRKELSAADEEKSYKQGRLVFINYYCKELYQKLRKRKLPAAKQEKLMLLKYKPSLYLKFLLSQLLLR